MKAFNDEEVSASLPEEVLPIPLLPCVIKLNFDFVVTRLLLRPPQLW